MTKIDFLKMVNYREEYKLKSYPKPENYGGKLCWTVCSHSVKKINIKIKRKIN